MQMHMCGANPFHRVVGNAFIYVYIWICAGYSDWWHCLVMAVYTTRGYVLNLVYVDPAAPRMHICRDCICAFNWEANRKLVNSNWFFFLCVFDTNMREKHSMDFVIIIKTTKLRQNTQQIDAKSRRCTRKTNHLKLRITLSAINYDNRCGMARSHTKNLMARVCFWYALCKCSAIVFAHILENIASIMAALHHIALAGAARAHSIYSKVFRTLRKYIFFFSFVWRSKFTCSASRELFLPNAHNFVNAANERHRARAHWFATSWTCLHTTTILLLYICGSGI